MKQSTFRRYLTVFFFLTFKLISFSQELIKNSSTRVLDEVPLIEHSNKSDDYKYIDLGLIKNSDEDFSTFEPLKNTLKNVEIVMLGEQSHGEGTTYDTKIKLIKYLHQEMNFDLLVFESDIYNTTKVWNNIKKGEDASLQLATSLTYLWSTTKEFRPLAQYIDENKNSRNPLIISGFDYHLSGIIAEKEFIIDLKKFILKNDKSIIDSKEWKDFETSFHYFLKYKSKKYTKKQALRDIAFLDTLISKIKSNDLL